MIAFKPVGREIDDVLTVSSVELMAWPFVTACFNTSSFRPATEARSVAVYDLVGMSSMATRLLDTISAPVVPAGILPFATTADVLTGACTLVPEPAFLLAPWTLAYAIALPAMNRITPIITNISVCLFTEDFPLSTDGQLGPPVPGLTRRRSVGGYDALRERYIGPFDHSPMQRPW